MKTDIFTKPYGLIEVGKKHYVVEVANTDELRYKGLSKRTKLDEGHGMFFEMPDEDCHAFQMAETYIPLDMLFIGKHGNIVDYIPNAQPLTEGPYMPREKCKYILEVNGNDLSGLTGEVKEVKMEFFDTMEDANAKNK